MYFFHQKSSDIMYENVIVSKINFLKNLNLRECTVDIYVIKENNKIIKYANYHYPIDKYLFFECHDESKKYKRISEEEFQVWYFLNS